MAKRLAESDVGEGYDQADQKRVKLDQPSKTVEINSSRQLRDLLYFQQDAVQQLRNGISSFKVFLETILYTKDDQSRPHRLSILKDYLDASAPQDPNDPAATYVPHLVQAWSFASQTNNDYLASAVSSILALLLKTLSSLIDFREHCSGLCKSLIKQNQLKLIAKSLAAPKHRENLISPSLRLLTEIVSFDGGLLAKQVYARRDFTFETKILARNLSLTKGGEEDLRKPSVRSNAVRYLLAHFRYQTEGVKVDILKNGHVVKALFDHLKEDPLEVMQDILRVVEASVLRDETVPRSSKSFMLSERSLTSIVNVVRLRTDPAASSELSLAVEKKQSTALDFLRLVCTTESLGVHRKSSWYPVGMNHASDEASAVEESAATAAAELDLASTQERFAHHVPVKNTILSGLLQYLRPHASIEERNLTLDIFKANPELVADYFFRRADKFPFDAKLTNTWIGYASFLFCTVDLDLPTYLGAKKEHADLPPPTPVVLENIAPLPLTQKALTRCLNQSSDLITLFAVRIMIKSLQKLQLVLNAYASHGQDSNAELWDAAAASLISRFCQRFPSVKDVVSTFRKTPEDQTASQETITRLLRLYHEVLPQAAAEEKIDVSTNLATALSNAEHPNGDSAEQSLRLVTLEHLLVIAQASTGMRWWHKQGSLQHSPFVTLLRLCTGPLRDQPIGKDFKSLLGVVVQEYGILQEEASGPSLNAIIASLTNTTNWTATNATFDFLEECLSRVVKKPVKYLDDFQEYAGAQSAGNGHVSLLVMACLEQAPFAAKLAVEQRREVLVWVSRFLALLERVGENRKLLRKVRATLAEKDVELPDAPIDDLIALLKGSAEQTTQAPAGGILAEQMEKRDQHVVVFKDPPAEKSDRPELFRWQQKDVDEAIDNGDVKKLILCISSSFEEVRRQALASLLRLMTAVYNSSYEEKEQVYMLLGEVVETAKDHVHERAVSYIASTFACQALKVLADPGHFMYPKVNQFLNKGPKWNVGKLVAYWLDSTMLETPDEDDAHWKEIGWTLDLLLDALRTPGEMDVFRSRNVLERVLCLYDAVGAPWAVKEKVLQLAHRAARVEGSTILVTRLGILAWLQLHVAAGKTHSEALKTIAGQVGETAIQEKLEQWTKGGVTDELLTIASTA